MGEHEHWVPAAALVAGVGRAVFFSIFWVPVGPRTGVPVGPRDRFTVIFTVFRPSYSQVTFST